MPLDHCNEAQLRAVRHFTGPMLLIAGPGSGKTFTITERIRYLIEVHGVEPSQILVITFTKAAALEMEQRFGRIAEGKGYSVNFGTFHAVYFHILKETYHYSSQNIITEKEKRAYLKQIIRPEEEESELIEHLLNEFGKVKNSIGGIETYQYEGALVEPERFAENYRCYRKTCIQERKMDFDDMALQCLELFKKRQDILEKWQKRFSFIMIDEFQDINLAQYAVVRLLAGSAGNLTAVGDDDQSIYGFRGADPSIMRTFLKDFTGAKTVKLDKNYRSAKEIVRFASELISNNNNRFPKKIEAQTEKAGTVWIKKFDSKDAEYEALTYCLKGRQKDGTLSECAVICRTNREVSEMKERLKKAGIPFCGKESKTSVFGHFIMQDITDYIRFAKGDKSRGLFFRIMEKPKRYFSRDCVKGEVDFDDMRQYYREMPRCLDEIGKLEEQLEILKDLSPFLAVNYIRKAIGYDRYLSEKERKDKPEKLFQIAEEIQQDAAAYQSTKEWMASVEERQTEEKRTEKSDRPEKTGVSVVTMHGAKGLEYGSVFLPNINEGTVPFGKMLSKGAEEEERRIFYVAVTRAKEELGIFCIENENREKPSRFLSDISVSV